MDPDLVGPAGFQPAFDRARASSARLRRFQCVTARLPLPASATMAIFLRLCGDRASGASTVPLGLRCGTPETIAR